MKRVKYYGRVFAALAKCSFMTQLEYRMNYISSLLIEIAYALVKLIYVAMVYRTGCHIGIVRRNAKHNFCLPLKLFCTFVNFVWIAHG